MRKRLVPFSGDSIRPGERGPGVIAVKRALADVDGGSLKGLTPRYGPAAVERVKSFQISVALTPTGNYGPKTHKELAPHFDDFAVFLYTGHAHGKDDKVAMRKAIVAAMVLLYNHRGEVHYTQSARRMQGVRERLKPPKFPRYEDCSSSSTWAYFVAGAPDPNGRGYDGQGYTGTLCQHGRVVSLAQAKPGDLVFYGGGAPWQHVAVYIGGGRVISHGSEAGPYLLPIDYRSDRGEIRSYL